MNTPQVFDPNALLATVDDNLNLVAELTQIFLEDGPEQLGRIRAAIGKRDALALERAAHTLKGSAVNFHAEPLKQAAFRLERMGRDGEFSASEAALAALETEMDRFEEAILTWTRRITSGA